MEYVKFIHLWENVLDTYRLIALKTTPFAPPIYKKWNTTQKCDTDIFIKYRV